MDDNQPSPDSGSRPRSISYLSTLFRRTASISENWPPPNAFQESTVDNQRRFSESSLPDNSEVPSVLSLDNDAVADDDLNSPESVNATHRRSYRSETLPIDVNDGFRSSSDGRNNRPRANSLTGVLLSRGIHETTSDFSTTKSEIKENESRESGIYDSGSSRDLQSSGETMTRETSQTDHINKRLLESFLTRINSVAATFISGSDNPNVQSAPGVYTDDVLMDHILRRVESPHDNK